jgi:uncharacterized coiled-coil protein SlyX
MADLTPADITAALVAAMKQNNSFQAKEIAKAMNGGKAPPSSGSSGGGGGNRYKDPSLKGLASAADDFAHSIKGIHGGFAGMATQVASSTSKVTTFSKSVSLSGEGLSNLSKGLLSASIAAGSFAVEWVTNSYKTFESLANVGQTFGGSLLNMQIAAAQAALPLDEFAKAITDNKEAIGAMGQQQFFQLGKQLRDNMKQFGQLSMSVSETNDVVSSYTTTMGMFGKLQTMSTREAVSGMTDLATESSALADLTGKNRMEMLKSMNTAMGDAVLRARAMEIQGDAGQKFAESTQKAVMFMSALPGTAGDFFAPMMANTIGAGTSLFSEGTKTLVNAGLGQISGMMDSLARKEASNTATDADRAAFYQNVLKTGEANMASLQLQAQAGNQDAIKMIGVIADMENDKNKFTEEGIRKAREESEARSAVTHALGNLETQYNEVTSNLKLFVLKNIKTFVDSPVFQTLQNRLETLMGKFETMIQSVFTDEHIQAMATFATNIAEAVVPALSFLFSVIGKVVDAFNFLSSKIGGLGAAITLIVGLLLAKKAYLAVKDELQKSAQRMMSKDVETGAEQGISHALVKFSNGSALRVVDISHPLANNSGGGVAEELEEAAGKGGGKSRWGKIGNFAKSAAGHFNKFGLPALTLASVAADGMMDDKNPAKKTVTSAISGASTGMAIGEMAAPLLAMTGFGAVLAPFAPMIGAALGGAIGAISQNWGTIKGAVLGGFKSISDKVGSLFNWFGDNAIVKYTPLGLIVNLVRSIETNGVGGTFDIIKNSLSKAFSWVSDKLGSFFNWFGDILKYTPLGIIINLVEIFSKGGFSGVFASVEKTFSTAFGGIESVFKKVFGFIGDKLSWLANLDIWGMIKKFLPNSLSDAIDVLVGNKTAVPASTPTEQNADISKLKLEVSQMENTIASLRTQLANQQKDNTTMHKQLATLIDKIEHGNNQNAALLGANLDATKKGNQIMRDPLSSR